MSPVSVLETSLVIESELGEEGGRELDLLLLKVGIEIIAFTEEQLKVARSPLRPRTGFPRRWPRREGSLSRSPAQACRA